MVQSNYEILGVRDGASKTEIRDAFRKLALEHHSDRGGDDEKFKHKHKVKHHHHLHHQHKKKLFPKEHNNNHLILAAVVQDNLILKNMSKNICRD